MNKSTLGIALLAGLAISGGSAFTAGNDMDAVKDAGENVAGYGAATVTGATVTNISYDLDDADPALLDAVSFVATGNLTSKTGTMVLRSSSSIIGDYTCTSSLVAAGTSLFGVTVADASTRFTCTATDVAVADLVSTGFTVSQ